MKELGPAAGYEALHASIRRLAARLGGGRLGDRLAAYGLLGPDLVVLARRLLADERVPKEVRGEIYGALLYVAVPFDLVPESLFGPAGLVDDALVLTRLLDTLLNKIEAPLVREHWPGDPRVLETARGLAAEGRKLFGAGMRTGLRLVGRRFADAAREAVASAVARRLPGARPTVERLLGMPASPEGQRGQGLANDRPESYTTS